MAMKFLNKLYVKAIYSEAPELNITPYDMGENMIELNYDDDVVTRHKTATGTIASMSLYVGATVSIHIAKSSPAIDIYKKRIISNSVIGGTLTLYDDINGEWIISDISLNQKSVGPFNGTDPSIEFQIQGNLIVNKDALDAI